MSATVSIIICTYNGAKYLREQLDSIFAQTYPLYEVIVQDDGSSDETWKILQEYVNMFPQMRTFHNMGAHGVNANFLSAMQRATGEYIAIADQDDIWEKDKIASQMEAIGNKLLCSGHSRPFSTDGSFAHFDNRPRNVSIFRMLFLCLPGHTLLFKRELLAMLPPLHHPFYRISLYDAALSITASAHNSIVFIDKILVNFRRHAEASTYTDYSKSLPSWRNALTELVWGLKHYHETREVAIPIYEGKLALLNYFKDIKTQDFIDAKRMMLLECKSDIISLIHLQYLFMKHAKQLFHTSNGGITKQIRAILYPFMQLYMYHDALLRKK